MSSPMFLRPRLDAADRLAIALALDLRADLLLLRLARR
jgi:predicted nucleic acid-binding protein